LWWTVDQVDYVDDVDMDWVDKAMQPETMMSPLCPCPLGLLCLRRPPYDSALENE